jgi:hypothetical protein
MCIVIHGWTFYESHSVVQEVSQNTVKYPAILYCMYIYCVKIDVCIPVLQGKTCRTQRPVLYHQAENLHHLSWPTRDRSLCSQELLKKELL